MAETTILNTKTADSSSKIIFDNPILCSQFLRDYVDHPYLKDVRPEDIEDVSEQYVPLFAEERNADRVKKVHIKIKSENTYSVGNKVSNEIPFFLISLIEHKTKIDYTVSMQIFRYMVYIWETYAREAEKLQPGITKQAGFKYPPILPIVYYEGSGNWTVPLRKYSNEELLSRKDEISLVMLINRMQNEADIEEFKRLPAGEVHAILEETPEQLLNIISDILRAFLLKMKVSVEETEQLVGRVKEKKMGILFENVVPFDIEKERAKTREQQRRAETEKQRADRAEGQVLEAQERVQKAQEQVQEVQEQALSAFTQLCRELGLSQEDTLRKIHEKFGVNTYSEEVLAKLLKG